MKMIHLSVAMMLIAPPVLAGGLAQPAQSVVLAPAEPAQTWTGFYAGLQVEDITRGASSVGSSAFDGTLWGGFIGYRYDFGDWVLGVEFDYLVGEGQTFVTSPPPGLVWDDYNRFGIEIGYDLGHVLVYGTAGRTGYDITQEIPGGTVTAGGDGIFMGFGIDYLLTDRFIIGAEILHDDVNVTGPFNIDVDLETTVIGISAAYRF